MIGEKNNISEFKTPKSWSKQIIHAREKKLENIFNDDKKEHKVSYSNSTICIYLLRRLVKVQKNVEWMMGRRREERREEEEEDRNYILFIIIIF